MTEKKQTTVIALGGNAILQPGQAGTFDEQMTNVRTTASELAKMVASEKYKLVVTHGNGPQVGNILLQNEAAKDVASPMPLFVCGAESQGLIGYMMQQNLCNLLADDGRGDIPVVTVITQVIVDKEDPAFHSPSKPVGPFYTEEDARKLESDKGYDVKEDAGRGWRRVVPSPDPLEIFEREAIRQLVDGRSIVIASGGGGIPVVREGDTLQGVDAVIDKDLAGERLAEDVDANIFLVLTDVQQVMLDYGKDTERGIDHMTVADAKTYRDEGHFAAGSMEPKVRAAIRFVEAGGGRAIITSLDNAFDALEGKAGTTITKE